MAQTTPPTVTALPPTPNTSSPSTFAAVADTFLAALNTFGAQLSALATNCYNNTVDAFSSATASASSALDSSNSASSAFNSAATALSIASAPAYNDTSTTSLAIATGSKVFTVAAGKSWGAGMNMVAQATTGNSMTGTVVSYSGTTLTINVLYVGGSGTFASWAISLAPPRLGLVLLATLTPTAAAAVNALNVFSSAYDSYLIIGEAVSPAANDLLQLRMAVAGALDSGSTYAKGANFSATPVAGYGSVNSDISNSTVGTAGRGINFTVQIDNVNDASGIKTASVRAGYENATTDNYQQIMLSTGYKGGVVTGIGLFWSSASNFKAQGSIRIYGIQKA